jgi:acetolactate decarboxylase
MDGLNGEVISVRGVTWRVPASGVPVEVSPSEGIAFGIAAHGGREHHIHISVGNDMTGILSAIDAYLAENHVDHEDVVCAVEIEGSFSDVLLRTEAAPTFPEETLTEVLENEIRFEFDEWRGTLVGFRFPDASDGQTIPGLHFHAISANQDSGGHVHEVVTTDVLATIWVDELHPLHR